MWRYSHAGRSCLLGDGSHPLDEINKDLLVALQKPVPPNSKMHKEFSAIQSELEASTPPTITRQKPFKPVIS